MIACTHLPVIDGREAWRDNVFVERLWRTIKYEEVYPNAYNTVPEARAAIGKHLIFYNTKRTHSSLDGQAPDQVYINSKSPIPVAAEQVSASTYETSLVCSNKPIHFSIANEKKFSNAMLKW